MYFIPGQHKDHGLPHDPFKAIVSPRPVGWISTRATNGQINLAPYSFFNAVCGRPPIVMFSSEGDKDSVTFARDSGVFAANFAGKAQFKAMNDTSAALERGDSEFDFAKLSMAECKAINAPRVVDAPSVLECRVLHIMQQHDLDGVPLPTWTVFGQVVGIHIDERYLTDGQFDVLKANPVSRLGYRDFSAVEAVFSAPRPGE